ncbi:hypothetical protein M378DRAFT_160695, partial [Amanita muscaria Koide BX008]
MVNDRNKREQETLHRLSHVNSLKPLILQLKNVTSVIVLSWHTMAPYLPHFVHAEA